MLEVHVRSTLNDRASPTAVTHQHCIIVYSLDLIVTLISTFTTVNRLLYTTDAHCLHYCTGIPLKVVVAI